MFCPCRFLVILRATLEWCSMYIDGWSIGLEYLFGFKDGIFFSIDFISFHGIYKNNKLIINASYKFNFVDL